MASLLVAVMASKERQKGNSVVRACLPPRSRVPNLVESSHKILHLGPPCETGGVQGDQLFCPKGAALCHPSHQIMGGNSKGCSRGTGSHRERAFHFSAGRWRCESWTASMAIASSWPPGPGNSQKSARPCIEEWLNLEVSNLIQYSFGRYAL